MEKLFLVDLEDNIIGFEEKDRCHLGEGKLHRGFSIFLINDDKEILIKKRTWNQKMWPSCWTNACCSHPVKGESSIEAAKNILFNQFGISPDLRFLHKFVYTAKYEDVGVEYEFCKLFIGRSKINPKRRYRWVSIEDIERDISDYPEDYTPWFRIGFKEVFCR